MSEGLETLGRCPICTSANRRVMFADLEDRLFDVAGRWTLWRCGGCDVAYLDPRPLAHRVACAPDPYHTHADERRLRRRARTFAGEMKRALLGIGSPAQRAIREDLARHLPRRPLGAATLLDVGCGNGRFLASARRMGYRVSGLEPDDQAARLARARGLDVRTGSMPGSGCAPCSFEHITLSQTIEHLHRPRAALEEMLTLLKPGGRLWICTPNLGAAGLAEFGRDWRGLEPPRHLVLFDARTLTALLAAVGFERVRVLTPPPSAMFYFSESLAIRNRIKPGTPEAKRLWTREWARRARVADEAGRMDPVRAESITVVGFKPMAPA